MKKILEMIAVGTVSGMVSGLSVALIAPEMRQFFSLDEPQKYSLEMVADKNVLMVGEKVNFAVKIDPSIKFERLKCKVSTDIALQNFSVSVSPDCKVIQVQAPNAIMKNFKDDYLSQDLVKGNIKLRVVDSEDVLTGKYQSEFIVNTAIRARVRLSESIIALGRKIRAKYEHKLQNVPFGFVCIWKPHGDLVINSIGKDHCNAELFLPLSSKVEETVGFSVRFQNPNGGVVSIDNVSIPVRLGSG